MGEENTEEKQARLAKVEGVSLKGGFEHRRSGRGKSENKATCTECGNTDHFKAQSQFGFKRRKGRPMKTQQLAPNGETQRSKGKKEKMVRRR